MGGMGCCGAVLLGVLALVFFVGNPMGGGGGAGGPQVQLPGPSPSRDLPRERQRPLPQISTPEGAQTSRSATDEEGEFISVVLAALEDTWNPIFQKMGREYDEPRLVLFENQDRSACGFASGASGPFYCSLDDTVYLDLAFFNELSRRFGASGDFAAAYVIAHEVGHHVQNELGILPRVNEMRSRSGKQRANELSVRLELQADCLAGVWGRHVAEEGMLEEGDIEEGLAAAAAVGDDNIQRRTTGWVVPESFTHGTSKQRQEWFYRGLESGDPDSCETFN
jgi:predicted metalloprotease